MRERSNKRVVKRNRLELPKELVADFCRRNHIVRLALFGSILRDDFRKSSDVDILVDFEAEHIPGFLRLARMERDLSQMLGGRKVDLRTPQDLSRYFRDTVVKIAKVQYERV